jgi:hypothetical protein
MPTREKLLTEIVPALLIPPAKVVTSLTSMPLEPAAILPLAALRMSPEKDRGVEDENAVVEMPGGNRAAVGDANGKGGRIRQDNGAGTGRDRAVTADLDAAGNHAAAD